jgi:hypothetical protein
MERALKIIGRDKTLISELEVNSKGNAVKVPHSMNKASGKISNSRKAFSDTNFGAATRGYMKSINRLDESILQDVWGRTKEIAARRRGAPPTVEEDSEDERALIFDTWYCPFLSLSSVPTDGFRCYFLFYRVVLPLPLVIHHRCSLLVCSLLPAARMLNVSFSLLTSTFILLSLLFVSLNIQMQ